jgi:hypothetical protein
VSHPPLLSSATNPTEPLTTGETQETHHAEAEAMEPFASNEMDRGGASSLQPEFSDDDEFTGFPRENLIDYQIFAADPTSTRPSNSRTSKESIKFAGETINWVGDPLKAFADLIPMISTTDAIALSHKEAMNKMSHHLVDVSLSDLPFSFLWLICWIQLRNFIRTFCFHRVF